MLPTRGTCFAKSVSVSPPLTNSPASPVILDFNAPNAPNIPANTVLPKPDNALAALSAASLASFIDELNSVLAFSPLC